MVNTLDFEESWPTSPFVLGWLCVNKGFVVFCALKLNSSHREKPLHRTWHLINHLRADQSMWYKNRLWLYVCTITLYTIYRSYFVCFRTNYSFKCIYESILLTWLFRLKTSGSFLFVEKLHLSTTLTSSSYIAIRIFIFCKLVSFLLWKNGWLTWR